MGLLTSLVEKSMVETKPFKVIFWLFFLACGPAYFLSALWMEIPPPIYWMVILAAVAQLSGWVMFVRLLLRNGIAFKTDLSLNTRRLLLLSAIAFTIKLLLQLGSTHPALSQLAFGFRPIVIGYLHLVLLGVITIFIFGYIESIQVLITGRYYQTGVWIFISAIIVNEIFLMLQGVTGLNYTIIPFINEALFAAALALFCGLFIINTQAGRKSKN
jgi:hypothetical protein